MKSQDTPKARRLGKVYLPAEGAGAPVGQFQFILDNQEVPAREVEIGTPVTAETKEGPLVGTVVDMRTFGEDPVPGAAALQPAGPAVGSVGETMVATVQVFFSQKMRPPTSGIVREATREELLAATGFDRMDYRIPAGCIETVGGKFSPIYYDGRALLGPESAHLMVGGLSGQAAKTSYIGVLLAAALQSDYKETGERVAALIFNVKGEDMLWLDRTAEGKYALQDEDYKLYEAMGIKPEPFRDVTVYSPPLPQTTQPASAREDSQILCWDLYDIWRYLDYFFPNIYEDDKAQAFLSEYEEFFLRSPDPTKAGYRTFDGLEQFFKYYLDDAAAEDREEGWRSHHPATLRRLRRMLGSLPARCRGLLTREKSDPTHDIPTNAWTHGQVVVVDIAGLRPDVQSLVVARTCERMLKEAEEGDLGVDHLIVVTDELNAFAPQGATNLKGVRRIIQRISTQGRYAGISLFGAAQKLSKVDELTRDNAATRALGVTVDAELASGVYGRMPSGLMERIATLQRGYMALTHYSFRAPIIVRFPRPAWQTGRSGDKKAKPKTADALGFDRSKLGRLTEGIPADVVEDIISGAKSLEDAKERLMKARKPNMHEIAVHAPYVTDPNDPWGFESQSDGTGEDDPGKSFGPYEIKD